jgi:hypothetical protein
MPVEVKGVVEARKILRKLSPGILKEYNAQIAAPLKEIARDAKSMTPDTFSGLSNFNYPGYDRKSAIQGRRPFPSFVPTVVRRGLTYSLAKTRANRSGWVALVSMLNKSAAGAIMETAGRKNPSGSSGSRSRNPHAGKQFIDAMNAQIGTLRQTGQTAKTQGRLMGAALVENQGRAQAVVLRVLEQVAKTANDKIARLPRGN